MIDFTYRLIEKKLKNEKDEKSLTQKEKELFSNWVKKQEEIPDNLISIIREKQKTKNYQNTELDELISYAWARIRSRESAKKINW